MTEEVSGRSPLSTVALAAIRHSGECDIDRLMSSVASELRHNGYRVGGIVQSNKEQPGDCRCDMLLEELTTGRVHSIAQNLGPGASGCRLDVAVLAQAIAQVEASLRDGLDILVLNKFGKQEAEGRGLRDTIATAVQEGIPVVVGLNHDYEAAWRQFCGSEGQILAADRFAIMWWLKAHLPEREAQRINRPDAGQSAA